MSTPTRRLILQQAVLAAGLPGTALLAADSPAASPAKLRVVVTGGHPGDPEYGCGGTIARYSDLGHEVVLLYLNRGEGGIAGKPPEEVGAIRSGEARKACELLGARPVFAGHTDGKSVVDQTLRAVP